MWMLFLLIACCAALVSCVRLCRAAAAAGALPDGAPESTGLGLYEAAFLAGGPHRVTELTLVAMAAQRRVLLAHTGWATVVDPDGHDDVERALIASAGPEGQSRVSAIRAAHATTDAIRGLGDRLAAAGLAVPGTLRDGVSAGIRQVRGAIVLILAMAVAAAGTGGAEAAAGEPVLLLWFVLPLLLTTGCWVIALIEVHPYTRWASPAGQEVLRALLPARPLPAPGVPGENADADPGAGPGAVDRELLTALAVRGPSALPDPALRAALSG